MSVGIVPGRVAGIIEVKVDGDLLRAAGSFSWNLGEDKQEAVIGHTGVDGHKAMPQVPFIEGEIRVTRDLNVPALLRANNVTATVTLPTGRAVVLRNAWFAGEGTGSTEEGTMGLRYEGKSASYI